MNNKSLTLAVCSCSNYNACCNVSCGNRRCVCRKEEEREDNQATSQANACGNGEIHIDDNHDGSANGASTMDGGSDYELSGGTFCQNIDSQIQGDENAVAQGSRSNIPIVESPLHSIFFYYSHYNLLLSL